MVIYKDKLCALCGEKFKPTSPTQKYCSVCKEEGRRIVDRKRDNKRNRKINGYKEYTRKCLICGVTFKTYYSNKKYCGSNECEEKRLRINNIKCEKRRSERNKENTKVVIIIIVFI